MGRAIDMEKDIDALKLKVEKLENVVRGMTHSMDEMSEKSTKTKHIDLVDDVKTKEEADGKEEKANDEGSNAGSRTDNKPSRSTKKKTSKHGSDS